MLSKTTSVITAILLLIVLSLNASFAKQRSILVQSTTSTQNSGLYDYLLPIFEMDTGIRVNVVAVGTGQAIKSARNGDADILLVHAKASEEAFVAEGYGVKRFDLMYNDFVIIGPANDPEGLRNTAALDDALRKISKGATIYVSRGDDSGTHKKELALWDMAGVTAQKEKWHRETGSGMGATIRIATEMGAYTMTDRATWIAYGDKRNHEIVLEGYPELFNQYGLIMVNQDKHPHVNSEDAKVFVDWLLGMAGQKAISDYRVDNQQLFFPNAVSH